MKVWGLSACLCPGASCLIYFVHSCSVTEDINSRYLLILKLFISFMTQLVEKANDDHICHLQNSCLKVRVQEMRVKHFVISDDFILHQVTKRGKLQLLKVLSFPVSCKCL